MNLFIFLGIRLVEIGLGLMGRHKGKARESGEGKGE